MARTKQTARKTLVGKAPAKKLRVRAPTAALNESESQSIQNFVNTQQFSLKFDDQEKCEQKFQQTQLIGCQGCSAFYTCQSKALANKEYKQMKENPKLSDIERQKYLDSYENVWICEFCLCHNQIPFTYKPPKQQNPCVVLEKAPIQKQKEEKKQKILIFCIDISGSMDMSFEGKTRLQSVKQAILDEVNRLKYEKQKIKVGLVTFGSEVCLIGDGHAFKQTVLPTQLYKNFDGVINYLQKINNFCYPLQKSFNDIKKTISGLSVHGSTALGPGLLSAVQLSSKGSVGSKIILCTDGQSNVGMGGCFSDDKATFYERVAQHAKKRNVVVNILSLKGDRCNLKQLGKLSLATGGSILKIDPKLLGTQFTKIVKQNVIGTQSKIVVKLNRLFRICNGKSEEISADKTTLTQDFGNFSEDTQLNFQFDVVEKEEAQKLSHIDMGLYQCKKVPMQVQLTYIGRNNWRYLQVVTDWRQLTHNLEDIYEGANFSLFAASVLQRASTKIRDKQFREAQSIISGYWSLVTERFSKTQPEAQLNRFAQRIKKIQKILQSKVKKSGNQGVLAGRGKCGVSNSRGRGKVSMKKRQRSLSRDKKKRRQSSQEQQSNMSSDSEERVLYKQIRARERSRSRGRSKSRSRSESPIKRENVKLLRSRDKKAKK